MSRKSPIPASYSTHLPERVAVWLRDHPGNHRARDVAAALGCPPAVPRKDWSQRVAQILADFVRRGNPHGIVRNEVLLDGWKRPVGMYAVEGPNAEPATPESDEVCMCGEPESTHHGVDPPHSFTPHPRDAEEVPAP